MSYKISLGKKGQVDEILALTKACGAHMRSQGIDQWDENYPDRKTLERDIDCSQLYVLSEDEALIGIVVLNEIQDQEYELLQWKNRLEPFLVVHRLAVLPEKQGQGNAQKLMDFSEEYARLNGYKSIRLDTFTQNPRNQRFYERRNYSKIGEVYLKYRDDFPYICFELEL